MKKLINVLSLTGRQANLDGEVVVSYFMQI